MHYFNLLRLIAQSYFSFKQDLNMSIFLNKWQIYILRVLLKAKGAIGSNYKLSSFVNADYVMSVEVFIFVILEHRLEIKKINWSHVNKDGKMLTALSYDLGITNHNWFLSERSRICRRMQEIYPCSSTKILLKIELYMRIQSVSLI